MRPQRLRRFATVGIFALATLVVLPSARAAEPFLGARLQHGALRGVHSVCDTVGDDGAVLVYGYGYLDLELPQTVRGFCGVPTAKPRSVGAVNLSQLAADWDRLGRRLYVVTAEPGRVVAAAPDARKVASVLIADDHDPEHTHDVRPKQYRARPREISVFEIPRPPGGS